MDVHNHGLILHQFHCERCGIEIHYLFDPPERGMSDPEAPHICVQCSKKEK